MLVVMKNQKISPQKLRPVSRIISSKSAADALFVLSTAPQKAAVVLLKALKSAIANAEHNNGASVEDLLISKICIDQAFMLKRYTQKAKGRGARILKRYSHIRIELENLGAK